MKRTMSLRTKIVLIFIAVVIMVIMAFLGMHLFFFKRAMVRQSERDLKHVYETFAQMIRTSSTTEEEEAVTNYAVSVKTEKNITFALSFRDWQFVVITQKTLSDFEQDFILQRIQADFLGKTSDTDSVTVIEKTNDYTLQRVSLAGSGDYLECYGYMKAANDEERMFILSMPLEFVTNMSQLANPYFVIFAVICLGIGSLAVWFVTRRLTRPIVQLTEISKKMSRLDFSARFDGDQTNEIGVLGNNMNEMSSQLERTILQLQMSNEQLQKEIEEKNHVDDMRRDFISNVSHELKTPIALIQGYAEGLMEFGRDDPEEMAYYCDVIRDEAEKMNRMVKKLTTLNQLEFGEEGLEETDFDIMEMIRETVKNSRKIREEHQADVTVEGPASCQVIGDTFKIEEVINNFYSNAFNHLKEPNKITFSFDDLGPKIRISVHNTGDPIPEEDLDKVWIKFYKVDKARTRAYGGSGIGLSIVKAIMDAHQEECGVYNTEDGVTFWFELKKAEEGAENEEESYGSFDGELGAGPEPGI